MTIRGGLHSAAVLLLVLGLAACAQRPGSGSQPSGAPAAPSAGLPDAPDALVLRVEYVGGFLPPEATLGRIPAYSLYADGRFITDGPVAAIYPGPALPNLQVQTLDEATVRRVAAQAVRAGVAERSDLGSPPIADAPSTRFTLGTAEGPHVRTVYALGESVGGDNRSEADLTEEQRTGRARLRELLAALGDLAGEHPPEGRPAAEPYAAHAVAAFARPWSATAADTAQGLTPEPVPWPGPALPGQPAGRLPGQGCVVATGDVAPAVLAAARNANMLTPWSTSDGARWSVVFRPLLPDETGCADLLD